MRFDGGGIFFGPADNVVFEWDGSIIPDHASGAAVITRRSTSEHFMEVDPFDGSVDLRALDSGNFSISVGGLVDAVVINGGNGVV